MTDPKPVPIPEPTAEQDTFRLDPRTMAGRDFVIGTILEKKNQRIKELEGRAYHAEAQRAAERERAERAEAEAAKWKAKIEGSQTTYLHGDGYSHDAPSYCIKGSTCRRVHLVPCEGAGE